MLSPSRGGGGVPKGIVEVAIQNPTNTMERVVEETAEMEDGGATGIMMTPPPPVDDTLWERKRGG